MMFALFFLFVIPNPLLGLYLGGLSAHLQINLRLTGGGKILQLLHNFSKMRELRPIVGISVVI